MQLLEVAMRTTLTSSKKKRPYIPFTRHSPNHPWIFSFVVAAIHHQKGPSLARKNAKKILLSFFLTTNSNAIARSTKVYDENAITSLLLTIYSEPTSGGPCSCSTNHSMMLS
jgi:hypothetical protein